MDLNYRDDLNGTIFNSAMAGAGLCMTIITLFAMLNKRDQLIADEFFAFTNLLFLLAGALSFINMVIVRKLMLAVYLFFGLGFVLLIFSSLMLCLQY